MKKALHALLTLALALGCLYLFSENLSSRESIANQKAAIITPAEVEARKIILEAERQSSSLRRATTVSLLKAKTVAREIETKVNAKARKIEEAAGIIERAELLVKGRLDEAYGDIAIVHRGANFVRDRYFEQFEIYQEKIIFIFNNSSSVDIKPSLRMTFFNRDGFVTAQSGEAWWFNTIKPGERRVITKSYLERFGEAHYWQAELD